MCGELDDVPRNAVVVALGGPSKAKPSYHYIFVADPGLCTAGPSDSLAAR